MKSTTMLAMRAEAYTATQGANPILAHYDLTKDGKYSCQTYNGGRESGNLSTSVEGTKTNTKFILDLAKSVLPNLPRSTKEIDFTDDVAEDAGQLTSETSPCNQCAGTSGCKFLKNKTTTSSQEESIIYCSECWQGRCTVKTFDPYEFIDAIKMPSFYPMNQIVQDRLIQLANEVTTAPDRPATHMRPLRSDDRQKIMANHGLDETKKIDLPKFGQLEMERYLNEVEEGHGYVPSLMLAQDTTCQSTCMIATVIPSLKMRL